MPTITASPRALAAAVQRGLDLPSEAAEPSPRRGGTLAEAKPHDVVLVETDPAAPSNKQRKRAEFLELQRLVRERVYPTLRGRFPLAFTLPPVPLAIGIHKVILDIAGDEIDPAELSRFLRYWCTRRSYLIAVWRGTGRRNLDGSVSGFPTIEQRNVAGRGVWGDRYRPIADVIAEADASSDIGTPATADAA